MVTVPYATYQSELVRAHAKYLDVRDEQALAYTRYCKRESEKRDREISMIDPRDKEAITRVREAYDVKIRRQAHIATGVESRAWMDYRRESDRINLEHGMVPDRVKEIRAIMAKALYGGE